MTLDKLNNLRLPASADFHVHLRDNEVCEIVTRTIRQGGVNIVYVFSHHLNTINPKYQQSRSCQIWSPQSQPSSMLCPTAPSFRRSNQMSRSSCPCIYIRASRRRRLEKQRRRGLLELNRILQVWVFSISHHGSHFLICLPALLSFLSRGSILKFPLSVKGHSGHNQLLLWRRRLRNLLPRLRRNGKSRPNPQPSRRIPLQRQHHRPQRRRSVSSHPR